MGGSYTFYFEKLEVWKDSRQLVKDVYTITDSFPGEEKFGLTSQMRRAALSVPTNLAEGSSRSTKKDQAHFTTIAYSSLMELLNLLIISSDLGFLSQRTLDEFRNQVSMVSNKLNALRKAQLRS